MIDRVLTAFLDGSSALIDARVSEVGRAGLLIGSNVVSFGALVLGSAAEQWGPVLLGASGLVGVFAVLIRDRKAEEEIRDDLRSVIEEARAEARREARRARLAEAELLRNGLPVPALDDDSV